MGGLTDFLKKNSIRCGCHPGLLPVSVSEDADIKVDFFKTLNLNRRISKKKHIFVYVLCTTIIRNENGKT